MEKVVEEKWDKKVFILKTQRDCFSIDFGKFSLKE